jgi:hypothetical protein
MGIYKQKTRSAPTGPVSKRRPVRRDYVEQVQQRAALTNEAIDHTDKKTNDNDITGWHQRQIERYMAQLRSETVQARRLAEQIDTLSQNTTARKGKQAMTTPPTPDPGYRQRQQRRASDKSMTGGSQSSFNPLHPSMELPPEQLIRLLGLEDKKSRKKRKPQPASKPSPATANTNFKNVEKRQRPQVEQHPQPESLTVSSRPVPPARRQRREQLDSTVFGEQRRGWLLPALGFGFVAGVVVSAYLFWEQPEPQETVIRTTEPLEPAAIPSPSAAPVAKKATPNKSNANPADNPKWRAAIQAQEQRLRTAARQRINQRLEQASQSIAAETPATEPAGVVEPPVLPQEPPAPVTSSTPSETLDEAADIGATQQPLTAVSEPPLTDPVENSEDVGNSDSTLPSSPLPEHIEPEAEAAATKPLLAPATESDSNAGIVENLSAVETVAPESSPVDDLPSDSSLSEEIPNESATAPLSNQSGISETSDSSAAGSTEESP